MNPSGPVRPTTAPRDVTREARGVASDHDASRSALPIPVGDVAGSSASEPPGAVVGRYGPVQTGSGGRRLEEGAVSDGVPKWSGESRIRRRWILPAVSGGGASPRWSRSVAAASVVSKYHQILLQHRILIIIPRPGSSTSGRRFPPVAPRRPGAITVEPTHVRDPDSPDIYDRTAVNLGLGLPSDAPFPNPELAPPGGFGRQE